MEKQHSYPHFFNGIYEEMIKPQLSIDEASALGEIRFRFPLSLPGQEPFGFYSENATITLSIASLKFLNDLLLAHCWLGRHRYKLFTIDDYLLMLTEWRADTPPPEPLLSLGIPNDAGREPETCDLHVDWVKRTYLFILLHEIGHLRYLAHLNTAPPSVLQWQESRADQFALSVMGRLGLVSVGITQFFEWTWYSRTSEKEHIRSPPIVFCR
jgi:hypothetical protein